MKDASASPGGALLKNAERLQRSWIRHLSPRFVKNAYWAIVTRGPIHTIFGSSMYLPDDQRRDRDLIMGRYEPAVTNKIVEILAPGMTFVDVGANIGIFTMLAAKLVGRTGRVIAFEPVPENATIIRRSVELNRYQNITLHEKCIAATPGVVRLHLSAFRGSHSALPNPARSTGKFIDVESIRLESVAGMDNVDLMKIDVEGFELEVLNSLGKFKPRNLILEYNGERQSAAGHTFGSFLAVLRDFGYSSIVNLDAPDCRLEESGEGNLYCSRPRA